MTPPAKKIRGGGFGGIMRAPAYEKRRTVARRGRPGSYPQCIREDPGIIGREPRPAQQNADLGGTVHECVPSIKTVRTGIVRTQARVGGIASVIDYPVSRSATYLFE